MIDFEPSVLADKLLDLLGKRQKCVEALPIKNKDKKLFAATRCSSGTANNDLADLEPVDVGDDLLNVVWIVILSVDDNDVFRAAGDDQFTVDECATVAGSQPSVRRE